MHLAYLADYPEFIPTLARWHHAQWHYLDAGVSVEERAANFHAHLGRQQIPTTFVALEGSTLLGSASLIAHDMDTHPDLTPWLACVYVAPAYRRRGIGTVLVQRVAQEAKALGVETLYLFTPDKRAFYAHRGWAVLEQTPYRGYNVVVMAQTL
jgi:GNAT superfamily N-acetyltransferase